jgi:hypothetical protein
LVLVLLPDRQLRWMQPVLLKTMSHSEGCMAPHVTEVGFAQLLLCVTSTVRATTKRVDFRRYGTSKRMPSASFVYATQMDSDNNIQLSGPFDIVDSLGRHWQVGGIRIYDEGYSIIDVYVDFAESLERDPLHEDPLVIRQILARLRELGYDGPDFGHGAPGLQDDRLIVLEAPEAFTAFAASKGWKNLAEDYADDYADDPEAGEVVADPASHAVFSALMRRLSEK